MSTHKDPQGDPQPDAAPAGDQSPDPGSATGDAAEPPPPQSWMAVGTGAGGRRSVAGRPLDELEHAFERALTAVHAVFQPIVDRSGETVFGHEALLRADDPELPDPGSLLDAAERLNRIERLGRAMRRQIAVRFADAPTDQGLLFVNLHALDLLDRTLSSPYSPLSKLRHRVVLEITERTSLEAIADVRYRVAELRAMGYRIAIDDLGAGHARMKQFTLHDTDFVKLDMSLIRDIDRYPSRQRLVASIIAMCREQNIQVVGEGVETTAERDVLVALGCDLLQGYLFGRPGRLLSGNPR